MRHELTVLLPNTNASQELRSDQEVENRAHLSAAVLTHLVFVGRLPQAVIEQFQDEIYGETLMRSRYLREADFSTAHAQDLALIFGAYDRRFFGGACRAALAERRLDFRLSSRMIKAGGKTTRRITRAGVVSFEIAINCGMLFDAFKSDDRSVTVCGLPCDNRLRALQRIFEHELVHLVELLCFGNSDCSAKRFQEIAARTFLHRAHTHDLITRWERALTSGIRCGAPVAFVFEGRRLTGRVNRITKRATVLVEDAQGQPYWNGKRYKTYYVPLAALEAM